MYTIPVVGSTHGHGLEPKKSGDEVKYSEFGIVLGRVLASHFCELVSHSQFPSRTRRPGNDVSITCGSVMQVPPLSNSPRAYRQVALISVAAHLPGGSEHVTDVYEPVAISLSSAATLGAVTAFVRSLIVCQLRVYEGMSDAAQPVTEVRHIGACTVSSLSGLKA